MNSQTTQQSILAADIAFGVYLLLVAGLLGLLVSALFEHWSGVEWAVISWIAEKATGWKIGLAALLSLVSLTIGIYTDLYKDAARLKRMVYLSCAAIIFAFVLYFMTTRPSAIGGIFGNFGIGRCSLEEIRLEMSGAISDLAIGKAQKACQSGLIESMWISLLVWLALSLATLLGIKSSVLSVVRNLVGR